MTEEPRCLVCGRPLPPRSGPGRPRKVCRDEDSPTPGGCARWRDIEQRMARRGRATSRGQAFTDDEAAQLRETFTDVGHGYSIEYFGHN